MFATLLLFSEVTRPLDLWNNNWKVLSDDAEYNERKRLKNRSLTLTEEQIKNYALCEIEILLNQRYKSLTDYDLPLPDMSTHRLRQNSMINEELDYNRADLEKEFSISHKELNEDQTKVFNSIIKAVENKTGTDDDRQNDKEEDDIEEE
ncbi:hypothetical protein FRX31_020564 [Thalictrum thalictroides]|uniref:Uncharacterized protein n=1 Tax=Thalictrum thalictroides TaxID=46969 RepID=A0A7J6VZ27_THATH|nr:hypothetical protein FRX31_020564 [Thalictrum thalictroides]